jgi:hypothetical protein
MGSVFPVAAPGGAIFMIMIFCHVFSDSAPIALFSERQFIQLQNDLGHEIGTVTEKGRRRRRQAQDV